MIRVDGTGMFEVNYAEMRRGAGLGRLRHADDFEEIMSTHYGRMVVLDDKIIMFANPEDAAEYISFDLQAQGDGTKLRRRLPGERPPVFEHNGEQYFIVDSTSSSTPHVGLAGPDNWVKGQEQYAKGWIECFHAYQSPRPARDPLADREVHVLHPGRFRQGRLRGRRRRLRHLPVDVSGGVVRGGLQQHSSAERRAGGEVPGEADRQRTRFDPRDGDAGLRQLEEDAEKYNLKGVKLYTAEWNAGSRGFTLSRRGVQAVLREVQGARHQERPRPQGADDLAAGQGRVRRQGRRPSRRPATSSSTSSSSTWACRGSRTSASWRRRSPTSTPACRWSSAA